LRLEDVRGRLLISFVIALAVVLGLVFYADLSKTLAAFARFQWLYIAPILGLTLLNYLLRFVKWHFYLHQIGVRNLHPWDSLLMFFSGLSMVMTPGKIGEWLKSYLLRESTGTPFSRSAPIIVAERLTDAVAMLILASGGLLISGVGWQVLVLVLLLALAVVAVARYRPLAMRLLRCGESTPVISKRMRHVHEFYESSYTLFGLRNLLAAIGLGFVSWSGECIAFYLVLIGLGQEPSVMLVVKASFILAASTLAGSLFLLPGGLGVAEGGITGLCQALVGMTKDLAVASTLLIRFCTLWFGVSLGLIMLMIFTRRLPSLTSTGRADARG